MRTFDDKKVAALKKKFENSAYIKKVWTVDEDSTLTLEEYAEYISPMYKYVTRAEIIEKPYIDKEGKKRTFSKVAVILKGGTIAEWDLPYTDDEAFENDFEEGDELDLSTLKFYTEECLNKEHNFAFGELAE